MTVHRTAALALLALATAAPVFAGFAGTDLFLPSVGRALGLQGSFWHTALWIHNPSPSAALVTVQYLPRGNSNRPPGISQTLTVAAGETWQDMDVIGTLFGITGYGALRITSNVEVLASCRVYNQPQGALLKDTTGQDYVGIPAAFAIGSGQATQVLGGFEPGTPDPDFRNGFGYVEVSGYAANVQVTVLGPDGTVLGAWNDPTPLQPFENRYYSDFPNKFPGVTGTNLCLEFGVTGGAGKILAVGSLVANGSNDATTFEMQFSGSLLGGGGLSLVSHDGTLTGEGTVGNPLGIANGAVVRSLNGMKDAVTIAAGANITLTPSGSTLTIAATGAGGGGSGVPSGPAGGDLTGTYPNPTLSCRTAAVRARPAPLSRSATAPAVPACLAAAAAATA